MVLVQQVLSGSWTSGSSAGGVDGADGGGGALASLFGVAVSTATRRWLLVGGCSAATLAGVVWLCRRLRFKPQEWLMNRLPRPLAAALSRAAFVPTVAFNAIEMRVCGYAWYDRIDEHVVLGALPYESHARALRRDYGVSGVVNTCDEYRGPLAAYAELSIEQLYVPCVDYTPPSLDVVERALAFIDAHAARNGCVYVHCKAGKARSAQIVLCYLMRKHRLTPSEALKRLGLLRPQVSRTLDTRDVVIEFATRHNLPLSSSSSSASSATSSSLSSSGSRSSSPSSRVTS